MLIGEMHVCLALGERPGEFSVSCCLARGLGSSGVVCRSVLRVLRRVCLLAAFLRSLNFSRLWNLCGSSIAGFGWSVAFRVWYLEVIESSVLDIILRHCIWSIRASVLTWSDTKHLLKYMIIGQLSVDAFLWVYRFGWSRFSGLC